MHQNHKLNWEKISWEEFQTLTIHFAQNEYPDTRFEEFLKKGHAQEGVDLQSFIRSDASYIFIQCKREKNLNLYDLKIIISEFELSDQRKLASEFILSTSADLQKPDLQKFLKQTAKRLKIQYGILFKSWDHNYLDEQLKGHYSIIHSYFGKEDADRHAFRPQRFHIRSENKPVPDFIPRLAYDFSIKDETVHTGYHFSKKTTTLKKIFEQNRMLSKQICLIADAYQGKSYLLQQTAYDLEQIETPFKPFLINIKNFPVQPIESLLNLLYGEWKSIPAKDLVLIFDGMDEVPADQFEDALREINLFSIAYPYISLIFSCRKLFYTRFHVNSVLDTFNTYELYPLQFYDVNDYLRKKLGNKFSKFLEAVSRAEINNLLYHPFYLTNLVNSFSKPPYRLPANKIQVLESFIKDSFSKQQERRTKSGQLHHQEVKYKKAIQKLAFALQLSGLNAFTDEQVQELLTDQEIELLQHNTLITFTANHWSFTNALFQEHLAALILSRLTYDQIIIHVTVGKKIKKIKSKWIQTISSLFSILEPSDERSKQLITFIEEDNIELIFLAERSMFSPAFRFEVLKSLLKRLQKFQIRPLLVYEDQIAAFIDHDPETVNWLIKQFTNKKYSKLNQSTILRIIGSLSSLHDSQQIFASKAAGQIENTTDAYMVKLIFASLAHHKIGDKHFIEKMTTSPLTIHHDFRDGLYELILALGLVDAFYEFTLDGYKALIQHNKETTHHTSEKNFENLLLASNHLINIKKLFLALQQSDWIEYYDRHSFQGKDFIQAAFNKAIALYKLDNTIVFPIMGYIKTLGSKHIREEFFKEIEHFFDQTNSHNLAIRIIIDDVLNGKDWELNALLRKDVFDYLLFEFDLLPLNISNLNSCYSALYYKQKLDIAEELKDLMIDYTEGKILQPVQVYSDYQKFENLKKENDLKFIKSQSAFRKGVSSFFKSLNKDKISEDELFIEFETNRELKKKSVSNFIYNFLLRWIRPQDKKVYLNQALKNIDSTEYFEFFRAKEILNYNFFDSNNKEFLDAILRKYFCHEITKVNFQNCIWEEGITTYSERKQKLLGQIFEKYAFDTKPELLMELVWVDMSGPRNLEPHHLSASKKSISELIIGKLKDEDLELFRNTILHNIEKGIKSSSVLGTHIGLCKHLQISEATDIILSLILNNKFGRLPAYDIITIYLDLGGDLSQLLGFFQDIKDYNSFDYIFMIEKLKEIFPKEIINSLNNCISSAKVTEARKLDAAVELCNLGQEKGFVFLAGYMKTKSGFPDLIHVKLDIRNLDTDFVLSQLSDLMFMLLDPAFKTNHFDESPKHAIIDWLYLLASKSEEDLEKIVSFIYKMKKELQPTYPNSEDLLWYATNAVERFRDSDKTIKNLDQVKSILADINHQLA